jgi:predicted RNA polymerase sigma factor
MSDVAKTIEAVWKIESTRLIAAIARVTHDIGIAEELAQDALVTACLRYVPAGNGASAQHSRLSKVENSVPCYFHNL